MTAVDYQSLIDAPTWDFIRKTESFYPEQSLDLPVAAQREVYDVMARHFHRSYPPGILAQDQDIAGVPCRVFAGGLPQVVYFHGGSLIFGGKDSHDDVCAEICAATGCKVVMVDYRLAPEHAYPASVSDALAVVKAVIEQGNVVLAGDSAGGFLCGMVASLLRTHAGLKGQVLIYPGLGGDKEDGSYAAHANAPLLTLADLKAAAEARQMEMAGQGPFDFLPLQDRDFAGLPPTVAFAAECDPLADDSAAYAAAISAAGGKAVAFTETGLVHGYLRARAMVPRATASFERICQAIAALAADKWPYGDTK